MKIGNDWDDLLQPEFKKDYYLQLREFLKKEYANNIIYPDKYDIFNAFKYTSYSDTKVVLLGQDPYHGPKQAHGLSFSVKPGNYIPPSLQNIYKELENDIEFMAPPHGCLIEWAEQGVLLLNTVLTVQKGKPNSHKGKGWETFTDAAISHLNNREKPVIFLLWGKHAQSKKELISDKHFVYTAAHPSPYSASNGFFGSNHFSKVNQTLKMIGQKPIDWQISQYSYV